MRRGVLQVELDTPETTKEPSLLLEAEGRRGLVCFRGQRGKGISEGWRGNMSQEQTSLCFSFLCRRENAVAVVSSTFPLGGDGSSFGLIEFFQDGVRYFFYGHGTVNGNHLGTFGILEIIYSRHGTGIGIIVDAVTFVDCLFILIVGAGA